MPVAFPCACSYGRWRRPAKRSGVLDVSPRAGYSAVIYVALGWAVIWFLPGLIAGLPALGLGLLIAGGVCYTVGAVFYVLKKVPYMHFVFHLLVLAGTVFQFFWCVLLFVV